MKQSNDISKPRKLAPDKSGSFVLTLPLKHGKGGGAYLDTVFRCAQQAANRLIEQMKPLAEQLVQTPEYLALQEELATLYRERNINGNLDSVQRKRLQEMNRQKSQLLRDNGFSEYHFHALVTDIRKPYAEYLGAHVAQAGASKVWRKFNDFFWGKEKEIRFIPNIRFFSIEGKSNKANIMFLPEQGRVRVNKQLIQVCMPGVRENTSNRYQRDALAHRVKYCRIIRIPWNYGWKYQLQLVLEGEPPMKVRFVDGKPVGPKYSIGQGGAGVDIGTQTVAIVGKDNATLVELADKATTPWKKLEKLNRAMDRSRKATNPSFFYEDGRAIPRDKLKPEQLNDAGRRKWVESKHYVKLKLQRRALYAKLARVRKNQHNHLANQVLGYGGSFFVEDMRFRALAKKSKRKKPVPGKREASRKRFGKSIANKAPASFVEILAAKVARYGGQFQKVDTFACRASQYDHISDTYTKKRLSARWAILGPAQIKVQRDMYSAFLLAHTTNTLKEFNRIDCISDFDGFRCLHDKEIVRLSSAKTLSSMGIHHAA